MRLKTVARSSASTCHAGTPELRPTATAPHLQRKRTARRRRRVDDHAGQAPAALLVEPRGAIVLAAANEPAGTRGTRFGNRVNAGHWNRLASASTIGIWPGEGGKFKQCGSAKHGTKRICRH